MADIFKFEVGAIYKNMKGAYKVVSIQKNSMVIRWNDGSEATTTVDLQMRIIERMALEKGEQEQKKRDKLKKKNQKVTKSPRKSKSQNKKDTPIGRGMSKTP